MAKIKQVTARQIIDSRGNPTIETAIVLNNDQAVSASVPAGASVGTYEAAELRDQDSTHYSGKGVTKAVKNIEDIIGPKILGMDPTHQQEIDKLLIDLDGTQNKSNLGANALLSVSIAVLKAGAKSSLLPLFLYVRNFIQHENLPLRIPTPMFNILNGGLHGGGNTNFQEYMVIPPSSAYFYEALERGIKLYHELGNLLKSTGASTLIGDEGGYAPTLSTNIEGLALMTKAAEQANIKVDYDIFFGIDAAASTFYTNNHYQLKDKPQSLTNKDLINYYGEINNSYHLLYLEDGLAEDDWDGWTELCAKLSQNTMIVGDDLLTTNPYRLQMAINKKAATGIIVKPNQIGTILETVAVVEMARAAGFKIIVAHRSGETNDDFIADFSVGVSADYTKFGAPARGERVAKYNRLLAIEQQFAQIDKK